MAWYEDDAVVSPPAPREASATTEAGQPTVRTVDVSVMPAYAVRVGPGLLDTIGAYLGERPLGLVTDRQVNALYGDRAQRALEAGGARVLRVIVAPGEDSKSIATWGGVLERLARAGIDRGGAVVALGGGVVGDLAGFAAASHLRGVPWLQVPTSLLAMVDASVGGKTGVNLPEGKNLVGAFWQPMAVVADVSTLASLPVREFRQGGVELFKHGLLADPSLLELFRPGSGADFGPGSDARTLTDAVARSVAVKAAVVAADEREAGVRAHLNLGHSLGHAIEALTDHAVPHGDAVAHGILFASLLAKGRGWTDLTSQAAGLLRWLEPDPLPANTLDADALAPYLARDKKNSGGRKRFVLLTDIARPLIVDDVSDAEIRNALAGLREVTHDLGA